MNLKKLICVVLCVLLLSALCALIIANKVRKESNEPDFLRGMKPNTNYRANIKTVTEATPNPHALVSMTSTTKPITEKPLAKRNTTAKDIFEELGKNEKQIIQESIYNENLKMCWNNILYVNESNNNVAEIWYESQVTLHFPGDDSDDLPTDGPTKEYKKYTVQNPGGDKNELVFEVVKIYPNYAISKHENISCRTGTYLSKAYYEWPQTGHKKVVLRLTDEHRGFEYDRDNIVKMKKENTANEVFLGSPHALSEKESDDFDIDDDSFEDITFEENTENRIMELPKAQNKDIKESKHKEDVVSEETTTQGNQTKPEEIVSHKKPVVTEYSQTSNQILPSVSPCSPILTQLLAGNGLLPGLCNLKKDETVVLQGDIVVFKKYFKDHEEVFKPMFVIHEKTEIETKQNDTGVNNHKV